MKQSQNAEFYRTAAWKKLRYQTLAKRGATCESCGARAEDGRRIGVDHIEPLRTHWHLRLKPSNLQVRCDDCSWGKSGLEDTDWRYTTPPRIGANRT